MGDNTFGEDLFSVFNDDGGNSRIDVDDNDDRETAAKIGADGQADRSKKSFK